MGVDGPFVRVEFSTVDAEEPDDLFGIFVEHAIVPRAFAPPCVKVFACHFVVGSCAVNVFEQEHPIKRSVWGRSHLMVILVDYWVVIFDLEYVARA